MHSELKISFGGFPPFSARYCRQSLTCSSLIKTERTLQGNLVALGSPFKKYTSRILGKDRHALATDSMFAPGDILDVSCIQYLYQKVDLGACEILFSRPFVKGSLIFVDTLRFLKDDLTFEPLVKTPSFEEVDSRRVKLQSPLENPLFVGYRPILTMLVRSYHLESNEWEESTEWVLDLEEV